MTQIETKTVWNRPPRNNKTIILNTPFRKNEIEYSFYKAITLYISIPTNQTDALSTQNHFYFTNDEKSFYGSKIIKDIMVYR